MCFEHKHAALWLAYKLLEVNLRPRLLQLLLSQQHLLLLLLLLGYLFGFLRRDEGRVFGLELLGLDHLRQPVDDLSPALQLALQLRLRLALDELFRLLEELEHVLQLLALLAAQLTCSAQLALRCRHRGAHRAPGVKIVFTLRDQLLSATKNPKQ